MTNYVDFYECLFRRAEKNGSESITKEFEKQMKKSKKDYYTLTAITVAVNSLNWYHYKYKNNELTELYANLYYKAREISYERLKDDEEALSFYFGYID